MNRRHLSLAFIGAAAVGASIFVSCSTFEQTVLAPPQIEGASFVGNSACADCHQQYTRSFAATPHARIHLGESKLAGLTGCESCHGAGSKHIAAPADKAKFIVNPGKNPATCFTCHLQTHAQFNLPQHHPVLEGRMNCVQCHDPHGQDMMKPARGLAMARLNESCAQCHREQAKPHAFEHAALREGCTTCHAPHGSINAKLLLERDSNLCLKCHAQTSGPGAVGEVYIGGVPHADQMRMGTCFTAGCHTAVHGSNIDRRLIY